MPDPAAKSHDAKKPDPQSELIYDPNGPWIIEVGKYWSKMTQEEILADFMKNEGSQSEEWPDFGAFSSNASPP